MSILFAGDTHGDQRWLGRLAERYRPSAIVHLGDIQLEQAAEQALGAAMTRTRFLWIAGNHDYDTLDYYERLFAPALAKGALHGRVIDIDGVRIAGLGGWFQTSVWRPPAKPAAQRRDTRGLRSADRVRRLRAIRASGAIWPEDIDALSRLRADVLVCHEAPSCHHAGFAVIDELARAMGVQRIFHGHHHETYRTAIGGIQVFGVGLRGLVDLNGEVIRPAEKDDARQGRYKGRSREKQP